MTRKELISSKEYHLTNIQLDLFRQVDAYLKSNSMTRADFAKKMGVSKGYVSQLLGGDFDSRLSKLVELSLAIGQVPSIQLVPIQDYLMADAIDEALRRDAPVDAPFNPEPVKK
jgi:transcriptional regulator with XRE-family HTH domain